MARFRGTVQGGRGMAHRLGHRTTGLRLHANSWCGSIEVCMHVTPFDEDWVTVYFRPNEGPVRTLYHGPLKEYRDPRGQRIAIITDKEIEHE